MDQLNRPRVVSASIRASTTHQITQLEQYFRTQTGFELRAMEAPERQLKVRAQALLFTPRSIPSLLQPGSVALPRSHADFKSDFANLRQPPIVAPTSSHCFFPLLRSHHLHHVKLPSSTSSPQPGSTRFSNNSGSNSVCHCQHRRRPEIPSPASSVMAPAVIVVSPLLSFHPGLGCIRVQLACVQCPEVVCLRSGSCCNRFLSPPQSPISTSSRKPTPSPCHLRNFHSSPLTIHPSSIASTTRSSSPPADRQSHAVWHRSIFTTTSSSATYYNFKIAHVQPYLQPAFALHLSPGPPPSSHCTRANYASDSHQRRRPTSSSIWLTSPWRFHIHRGKYSNFPHRSSSHISL